MNLSRRYAAIAALAVALAVPAMAPAAAASDEGATIVRHHRHHYRHRHYVSPYAYEPARGVYRSHGYSGTFPNDCATEGSGGRIDYGACGGSAH